jgi:hypothetical protein
VPDAEAHNVAREALAVENVMAFQLKGGDISDAELADIGVPEVVRELIRRAIEVCVPFHLRTAFPAPC